MKKIKVYLCLICIMMSVFSVTVSAAFNDVEKDFAYKDAIERVSSLGIMNGSGDGNFNPNNSVTREQFAKIMVVAAGLEDNAYALSGSTIFPDVDPSSWSTGFISIAVEKGYIVGYADGKFHPKESITFAQACTVLVKALGYADTDVTGVWPRSYIDKAKILGLTSGMNYSTSDEIPRWAVAVMVDKLMVTNVKKVPDTQERTFGDSTGVYSECIILGTSKTMEKLLDSQILTDKGIYYLTNKQIILELGAKYKLAIKKDTILNASSLLRPMTKASISSVVDNNISYLENSSVKTMVLPDKTLYYYKGVKQTYDSLKNLLQAGSSIIFVQNADQTGFEYAVIFDQVVSKPYIVTSVTTENDITKFLNNKVAVGNGETLVISDIIPGSVIYNVSDIWGYTYYNLVVKNNVKGKITGVLPNKYAPKSVQIDSKSYDLGKDFNYDKLNSTFTGSYKVGDIVTAIVGSDNKVVDITYLNEVSNSNYALVINYGSTVSDQIGDKGKVRYNVKLLFSDGTTATKEVQDDSFMYKGKLVRFGNIDNENITLEALDHVFSEDHYIDNNTRRLDDKYVAENVIIFNILSNESGAEVKAEVIKWGDLPYGNVEAWKVRYYNSVGDFGDINVLLTSDIKDATFKLAYVKGANIIKNVSTFTFLIDGKEYNYTAPGLPATTVYRVKMSNNAVAGITETKFAEIKSLSIDAIDNKRIKIEDKVFFLKPNVNIILFDTEGMKNISVDDIDIDTTYREVSIYADKTERYGGKIELIILYK